MAHKVFPAGIGQAVTQSDIFLKYVKLTATSTSDCTAIVYANGAPAYYLACAKGTSDSVAGISGGNAMALPALHGPITVDVVGTGAFLMLDY